MNRRSKVSQAAGQPKATIRKSTALRIADAQGLVAPVSNKTTTVTLRLSGPWHTLWKRLKASVPGVSDAELLRQGVALRMALAALDAKGEKPKAFIKYHDQDGKLQTADLEEYVGIGAPEE